MAVPITARNVISSTTPATVPCRTKRPSAASTASARNSGQSLREWVRMGGLLLSIVPSSSHEPRACDRHLGEDRGHTERGRANWVMDARIGPERRGPAGRARRRVIRALLLPPRRGPPRLLRAPHRRPGARGGPVRRDVRRRAHEPPPLPAGARGGRGMALRDRDEEARPRGAARLRRAARAPAAGHGADRALRRRLRAHRPAGRERRRARADGAPGARPARRDRRPRARGAALRSDRGGARHLGGGRAQAGEPGLVGDARPDGSAEMSEDFVTRLQLQLREAALREERRTPVARRVARARRGLPGPTPVAAALAVAVLALAMALGAVALRGEPQPAQPRIAADVRVATGPSSLASGFGSVWTADPNRGDILRIAPSTRRVVARITAGDEARVSAGAGGVWALTGDLLYAGDKGPVRLLRIDPATNRVVARIPMRTPAGARFGPLGVRAGHGVVWVEGATGALRIDPRRNGPDRFVALLGAGAARRAVAAGDRVWTLAVDGRLREPDART